MQNPYPQKLWPNWLKTFAASCGEPFAGYSFGVPEPHNTTNFFGPSCHRTCKNFYQDEWCDYDSNHPDSETNCFIADCHYDGGDCTCYHEFDNHYCAISTSEPFDYEVPISGGSTGRSEQNPEQCDEVCNNAYCGYDQNTCLSDIECGPGYGAKYSPGPIFECVECISPEYNTQTGPQPCSNIPCGVGEGRLEPYNTTEGCETCVPGKYSYDNLNAYCVDCTVCEYPSNITRTECAPDQNRECEDCAGILNGATVFDCTGTCGGTTVVDVCGVCGGDNTTCEDACGVSNGDNSTCSCGPGQGWNGTHCDDCVYPTFNEDNPSPPNAPCSSESCPVGEGIPYPHDGTSGCEVCAAGRYSDSNEMAYCAECSSCVYPLQESQACSVTTNTVCVDCNGDVDGTAYRDHCQTCVGGLTGVAPCTQDCAGVYGGSQVLDCAEVCGGTAYVDNCDICVGGTTGLDPCEQDCAGVYGGELVEDCMNVCNGTAFTDNCTQCVGGTSGLEPCTQDCAGVYGGSQVLDCAGLCGGTAFVDNCMQCVNGTTARTVRTGLCEDGGNATEDCAGICQGNTTFDVCGVCNGTGIPEGQCDCLGSIIDVCGICNGTGYPEGKCNCEGAIEDCAGVCAGNATIDECNQCDADPTNDNACFTCKPGKYVWFGLCYDCPVGQFQDQGDQYECKYCGNGTYTENDGSTACEQCEDGTYRLFDIEEKIEPCQTCPETMVSTSDRSGCLDCNGDFFGEHRPDVVGECCLPTEMVCGYCNGTLIQDRYGFCCEPSELDECNVCHGDSTVCQDVCGVPNGNGSICQCEKGFGWNSTACVACEYPEFSEVVGPFQCTSEHCGEGQGIPYPYDGTEGCQQCQIGRFSVNVSKAHCDACPAGYTTQASVIPDLFVDVPEHFRDGEGDVSASLYAGAGWDGPGILHIDLQFPTQIKSISYHSSEYFHMALGDESNSYQVPKAKYTEDCNYGTCDAFWKEWVNPNVAHTYTKVGYIEEPTVNSICPIDHMIPVSGGFFVQCTDRYKHDYTQNSWTSSCVRRYAYISYNGALLEAFEYEEEEDAPCSDIRMKQTTNLNFIMMIRTMDIFMGGHKVYETLLLRPSTQPFI